MNAGIEGQASGNLSQVEDNEITRIREHSQHMRQVVGKM